MIYVLGSINLDLIVSCNQLPKAGQTIIGKNFSTSAGGKSANQALAAARAGANVKMIGAVGNDAHAKLALKHIKQANIDVSDIITTDDNTGIALISVAKNGENSIIIVAGANAHLSPDIAQQIIKKMNKQDILLLAQEIPLITLKTALNEAKKAGIKTILNIAPFIEQTHELAPLADIIIANETEFKALINKEISAKDFANYISLYAKQNNKIIIITLGKDGALGAIPNGELVSTNALDIKPIDCVGAGDSFCGYLATMIEKGKPLDEAMKIASIAGSLACLKSGAQPAIPFMLDVNAKI